MKKLTIFLLIVIVVMLSLPGLLGKLAKDQIQNQLSLTEGNPFLTLKITDYDRGWFSSALRYELNFTEQYRALISGSRTGEPTERPLASIDSTLQELIAPFELESKLSHGPVGFLNGPFVGLYRSETKESADNPKLAEFLTEAGMPYLLSMHSTTSFFGTTTFDFDMPASGQISNSTANPATNNTLASKLVFSGTTGNATFAPGSKHLQIASQTDNLSIKDNGAELTLQGMTFEADQTLVSNLIGLGPANLTIGSFVIRDPDSATSNAEPTAMTMQDLSFSMDTNYGSSKQIIDVKASYEIGEMLIEDQTITDVELTVNARELSLSALQKYNDWSQEIAMASTTEPGEQESLLEELIPLAHEFASASPRLSIDPIKLTANGESFLASLKIHLNGSSLPALADFNLMDPAMWAQVASGNVNLALSEQMATLLAVASSQSQLQAALGDDSGIPPEQIQQMAIAQAPIVLQTLVQQDWLRHADGQISAALSFENGELLLNGKPAPMEALLGL